MPYRASAPGKLVVLGEYAVLTGAEALVAAVDRRCKVTIERSAGPGCEIRIIAPDVRKYSFAPGAPSGLELVDTVRFAGGGPSVEPAFCATLDSRRFFADSGAKLGMGSSAAVLTAFAGALQAFEKNDYLSLEVDSLIALHRSVQGGRGSGVDVAAAVYGGLRTFRLDTGGRARIGSVRLPNSVGFAGIFAGQSAITSNFVGRFEDWRRSGPARAAPLLAELSATSSAGCDALREDDADGFLRAVAAYGVLLESLGNALGCDVLTSEHRRIAALAQRFAVTYKTSGAGGGDLGIALSKDKSALTALRDAVSAEGFLWVDLGIDPDGLMVEEFTE
jgi:phosphomevalonate kinase